MSQNYYSSEGSDSEGEDGIPRRVRTFRPRINFHFTDFSFRERFRMSRRQFDFLYERIGVHFHHATARNHALTAEQQMLSALHWLGSGTQYHAVSDMHGTSKATVCRNLKKFVTVVVDHLFQEVVAWPENAQDISQAFYRYAGMPNVAACVDGTLIPIIAPTVHEEGFVDRHGNHSINAMMACGPDMKFYVANACSPGSLHDARSLRNSYMCERFDGGWRPFPGAIILGDSAYPLKDWLIPYAPNNLRNPAELRFYTAHKKTRHLVECAYGIMKEKFPCLNLLRVEPVFAGNIILTCATLHNLCRSNLEEDDGLIPLADEVRVDLTEEVEDVGGRNATLNSLLGFFN